MNKMKVLVTGGAGFIGSHTVKVLLDAGFEVVVYDNLSNGVRESVSCSLIQGDLKDKELLNNVFEENNFDAVIHFAGFIEAGESMKQPSRFFENNIIFGTNLLEAMVKNNVKKIIFSSSAAIYKAQDYPLKENDLAEPDNFYGETKLMFEKLLQWYDRIHGLKFIALRYFNAAGASFGLKENHNPETHIIPLILQTALGKRDHIKIFGTDYNTPDGTCLRDYVHVEDLANAHLLALQNLEDKSNFFNVGVGKGYSVKELIDIVKKNTGKEFKVVLSDRRPGDPPVLIANSEKIKQVLGWEAKFDINQIIKSAWDSMNL